jgi:hypothetical protein
MRKTSFARAPVVDDSAKVINIDMAILRRDDCWDVPCQYRIAERQVQKEEPPAISGRGFWL